MKQTIISLLLALLPLAASADAVEINGIYYNLVSKVKTAEVTSNPNKYSGAVEIPDTVTYDGVTYDVTSIGNEAFSKCGVTSVTIPNSVTNIGYGAFQWCGSLTSLIIPNSVTSIGGSAFQWCTGLTCITFLGTVTGSVSFFYCSSLTRINILGSVTAFEFSGCESLKEIHISDLGVWCRISKGFTGSEPPSYALYFNGEEIKDFVIPNSVTSIEAFAFVGCSRLKTITIPNSVTSIGCMAFRECSGLTSVTIPNSVTHIGESAFYKCSGLTSIDIPNSVTSIGECAFNGCSSLKNITIETKSARIGNNAFSSCVELTDVYCNIINPLETFSEFGGTYNCINPDVFDNSYIEYATLHVPTNAYIIYKQTAPWSNFGTIVTLEGEIPEISQCATPIIAYVNGELSFGCETEGVEFVYDIKLNGEKAGLGKTVKVSPSLTVSVYATKDGYDNSDVATKTIDLLSLSGDVDGNGMVDATDITKLIDILLKR